VPFPYNFDKLFGTWVDYQEFKVTGELNCGEWAKAQMGSAVEVLDKKEKAKDNSNDAKAAPLSNDAEATPVSGDAKAEPLLTGKMTLTSGGPMFSMEEVQRHKSKDDCWIVLYGRVLNLTDFLPKHPGGEKVVLGMAGKNATASFEGIHASTGGFDLVRKWAPAAALGSVAGY
ncbi:unnamed protein product, partial [Polarella glacialis]